MTKAIFPGSFDPFHEGHIYVVNQALEKFDFLYIIISWNENKIRKSTFKESFDKINHLYSKNKKIKIIINENKLTIEIARELNCFNVIRGIRNINDFIYEKQLALEYQKLEPKIKMFYIQTTKKLKNISSSKINSRSN